MVIGFKEQFVDPIKIGTKLHTIREDVGSRWLPGRTMHMYTGGRFSKEYQQFDEKTCLSTQPVKMWLYGTERRLMVTVGEVYMSDSSLRDQFAVADGFTNWDDFVKYWTPIVKKKEPGSLTWLKLIHWTNLKY